jgi:hypothetical protein
MTERIYHTWHPNSTFIVQKVDKEGKRLAGQTNLLQFHGTMLATEDPAAIAQLDETAALPGSPIYVDEERAKGYKKQEAAPFDEVKKRAGDVVEAIAKAGQRA